MKRIFGITAIVCIVLSMSALYVGAYTIRGAELTFTAEGEFERVLFKYSNGFYDLGYIYEDGDSFSYLTGDRPRQAIFQIVVYTNGSNYFDFMYSDLIGIETAEIGDVLITIESGYEDIGVINSIEWILVLGLGLGLGLFILAVVSLILEGYGIEILGS